MWVVLEDLTGSTSWRSGLIHTGVSFLLGCDWSQFTSGVLEVLWVVLAPAPERRLEHFPFVTLKQVHLAQGLILPSAPVEYMRFRDIAQGTGAQGVGLDSRSVYLRLRPNKEPSQHLALRRAHHWTTIAWMGLTPFYETISVALTIQTDFPFN